MKAADVRLAGADGRRAFDLARVLRQVRRVLGRIPRFELGRLVRPRSFITLMIFGFVTVAVPLSTAFVASSMQVEELASHGRETVYRAVQVAHDARGIAEQLASMERLARQYVVTGDPERLQGYEHMRLDFLRALERQLEFLDSDNGASGRYAKISANESRSFEALRVGPPQSIESRSALELLTVAAVDARALVRDENRRVNQVVDEMQGIAERAQRILFWHAIAAVPLASALAVVFFLLITRPVRAIDRAIRRLGSGDFEVEIRVAGPKDLEELGDRLEWLRTRLLDLEDQKRRFLRHVSHELKTPLTTIREGAELLADQVVGPLDVRQSEVAGILRENTLRLQKLIEDLLAFSRMLDFHDEGMSRGLVKLNDVVKSVCDDYKLALLRGGMTLELDLHDVQIEGNRVRLCTLIDNLVSNAIKYSPENGRIELALRKIGDIARLDVIDSGPGVAASDRERIFEAFYQSDDQPQGPVRGTGLGLSIAREIARSHGGDISMLPPDGRGARFRVTLPATGTARGSQ